MGHGHFGQAGSASIYTTTTRSDGGRSRRRREMHGRPARTDLAGWPLPTARQTKIPSFTSPTPAQAQPSPMLRCASPSAAFLPPLTVTSPPRLLLLASSSRPGRQGKGLPSGTHADSMPGQRQAPLRHMDGALLLASLVRPGLVYSPHLAVT
ncbi:hypothetical protein PAHAL_9G614300 [Panicum hallii]|uniref:Uncharacterized protein n=1 Tax=Panicum hallii TaxID=206008 RepID=A0A2S3IVA4_9POAL|nr:hypothetical protein PAHAL_9G614300 [Panicum hallii]